MAESIRNGRFEDVVFFDESDVLLELIIAKTFENNSTVLRNLLEFIMKINNHSVRSLGFMSINEKMRQYDLMDSPEVFRLAFLVKKFGMFRNDGSGEITNVCRFSRDVST